MSELSSQLAKLKGNRTTKEIIKAARCSRETFRRIERGDSVKLCTLQTIATTLGATKSEWITMAANWARHELESGIGADANAICIKLATDNTKPKEQTKAMHLFTSLPHEQRVQIVKTMERPAVIKMLPAIHAVFDAAKKSTTNPRPA